MIGKPRRSASAEQPGRHLVQVAVQLDRERGQAAVVELGDEVDQRVRVVAQRVAGGEQQLVRLDPGQDVRYFHDVEPRHDPVQPAGSGQDPRLGQAGRRQHLADPQAGCVAALINSQARCVALLINSQTRCVATLINSQAR